MIFLFTLFFLTASLAEKVGQLMIVNLVGEEVNEEARYLILDLHVGGIIYTDWANGLHGPEQVRKLSEGLQALSPTPLLIAVDQEGGKVARLKNGFTKFSGNSSIQTAQEALERGRIMGRELKSVGINLNFAPVVDILTDPQSPIGTRSFGDDPERVFMFASVMLDGFHESGLLGTLKHFPGLGGVKVDSHLRLPVMDKVGQGMVPFFVLKGKADAIMTAHIRIPELDPDHCATLSPKVLKLLEPYDGVIISDSLLMLGVIEEAGSVEEAAIQALNAGCDLLLIADDVPYDMGKVHAALVAAVESGRISRERVDAALAKRVKLLDKVL